MRQFVLYGWPEEMDEPPICPYYYRHLELLVLNGCVLWGSRVVVPDKGRTTILNQLHESHPGITRMKLLARSYVWWPGIDLAIENTVCNCQSCQENQTSPTQSPLHPWEWPHRPWARVHMDHAGPFLGHLFLILVDAHSKWIEAAIVNSTSTEATINKLEEIFSTHGYPEQLVSDNGTGFTSSDFEQYTQTHGIRHNFTAPYHPSSNGLAECAVQTLKLGLKKLQGPIPQRLSQFLLHYRTTPHSTMGLSPAEVLMHRRLRSKLSLIHPDAGRGPKLQ